MKLASARNGARLLAGGRIAIGLGLLAAPQVVARGWLGDYAKRPGVQAVIRGFGARDMVVGLIALHTYDHPEIGPRWQRTAALMDVVDTAATLAAARDLPLAGVAGTALIAGGAALAGLKLAGAPRAGVEVAA